MSGRGRHRVQQPRDHVRYRDTVSPTTPPPGTVLDLRTTTSQKCEAVPRRARIQGSWTIVSLNSRLESNRGKEEEEENHEHLSHIGVGTSLPPRFPPCHSICEGLVRFGWYCLRRMFKRHATKSEISYER